MTGEENGSNGKVVVDVGGQLRAKPSHRLPILSLVDREYLHSTANLPRQAWEPLSYLYSETDSEVARVDGYDFEEDAKARIALYVEEGETVQDARLIVAGEYLQWVAKGSEAEVNYNKMHRWLDQLLLDSQSVEALRSWQMVGGLQASNQDQRRPSATVMPDFPTPRHPGTPAPGGRMLKGRRREE